MKIVHWKDKRTEETGHGEPISDESADAWVERENRVNPNLLHWSESLEV